MIKSENLLEVRDLTVNFSHWGQTVKALESVYFSAPHGQWIMLVGNNGSGKSTLLKSISGLLHPDKGEILIQGDSIKRLSNNHIAKRVFQVYQDPILGTGPTLTLFENLLVADYNAQDRNMSRKGLVEKYFELLRPLGLSDRLKQLAINLSAGERQLLAILIARLRPSPLMLLDEPLASLDPTKVDLCIDLIKKLHQDGKSILQVTHDPNLAVEEGDRTIVMANGKIVSDETSKHNREALRMSWSSQTSWS